MSAPVTDRPRGAVRTPPVAIPAQRGPAPRERSGTRRDDLLRRLAGRAGRNAAPAGRAPFVLLVMALLATGLVATLWLSTAATSDSYRLQDVRDAAAALTAQSERLHREVTTMSSAPALAQRAAELGMVPVHDPARLVVAPGGAVTVVGDPTAATPPAAGVPAPATGAPTVTGPAAAQAGVVPADAASQAEPGAGATAPVTGQVTDPAAGPGGAAPAAAQPGAGQSGAAQSGAGPAAGTG